MFLALNEIRHSKLRYTLVIGVMFLIAYLVFFLTGLSYGLAQENRIAIDKWDADEIVLAKEADGRLMMSNMPRSVIDDISADEKAYLAQSGATIYEEGDEDNKIGVSFFAVNPDEFIAPDIIEGRMFENENEVVVDDGVQREYGLELNDEVYISGPNQKIKIVGFTDDARFSVSPVFYMSLSTFQQFRYNRVDDTDQALVNAIVIRGEAKNLPEELESFEIADFINDLPGYSAQVLTFGFMIVFLIIIAAIVIGIFIYVLTMQKTDIFGVMKAQGISTKYIGKSVIAQTFILALVGVGMGFVLTILSGLALPVSVPFAINYGFFISIGIMMILIAILGAFFSVRAIVKIDPLKAIG